MIGFEVFAVTFDFDVLITGVLSIGLALLARFAAVFIPVFLLQRRQEFSNGIVPIMTWGGLKGGGFPSLLRCPCLIANGTP
jgi:CPA1 family monovalent cation:H+ antiporter